MYVLQVRKLSKWLSGITIIPKAWFAFATTFDTKQNSLQVT